MTELRFLGKEGGTTHLSDAKIVIVPVPFDETSTWQKGADKGPQAILDASPHLELYDIETQTEVFRRGIYTAPPIQETSPETMVRQVQQQVSNHLKQNRFVVTLGGEHSVSIGAAAAHAKKHPTMSVLQLDAHSDLRDTYLGSKYNHACVMARIREQCPIVQVGIRSMDIEETLDLEENRVFYAHRIHDNHSWIDQVITQLTDSVYITIDLDVFDPGIMPSTGTPEPGGLGWYPVMNLLRRVAETRHVVGFDVVELCPGANKAPDFLAAKLIYTLLSYIWR